LFSLGVFVKNIIIAILLSFSSIASATSYYCEGAFSAIQISVDGLHLLKKVGVRTRHGEIPINTEIGKPIIVRASVDGLRLNFNGPGIEFIIKDGHGILTRSPTPEMKDRDYLCREYTPRPEREPYRPKPVCVPHNCR
jgi:hypothetical protein